MGGVGVPGAAGLKAGLLVTLSGIQLPHHLSFLLSEMVGVSFIIVMVFCPMLF